VDEEKNMIWRNIMPRISYTFFVFFSALVVCLAKMLWSVALFRHYSDSSTRVTV